MDLRPDDIMLELERLRLVLNPRLGASIVALAIGDQDGRWAPVLRTMAGDSESASDAGSFVMLPWTNRIKDARFRFEDQRFALRTNTSDGSAIHGVARNLPWTIADRSPITARFILDSRSFDPETINYPFMFGAVQRFEISPNTVEIDLSITNLDERPIPVGCGHHPYIHRHLFSDADDLRIRLDVSGRYPTAGCIPTDEPIDDPICGSLRAGKPIANPGLDDVFAGFGGLAQFDWAASNVRMTMRCSTNLNHLVLYTPTNAQGEPEEFVCVEPVSMVNDGFNRLADGKPGTGVNILEPNETMRTRMTLSFPGTY
jgi:aldose 1-epimerase